MLRYQWPGYKMQLLTELQKQQHGSQFCDTLLQTEDISIPAHSCILAALSPYLSVKLSTSASPPSGQRRQLQLQTLKAQTLLKLVGLLYSGELEVKGGVEQRDVLSAAHQFGITNLIEEQRHHEKSPEEPQRKGLLGDRERNTALKMQDAQVQSDFVGRAAQFPDEERGCVSIGTQTSGDTAVTCSVSHSSQTAATSKEHTSTLPQSAPQPQNVTVNQNLCSSSCPPVPDLPSTSNDRSSTPDQSPDRTSNPASLLALSGDALALPFSLQSSSDSPVSQEYDTHKQSSERIRHDKMADSSRSTEQQKPHSQREDLLRGKGKEKEKRQNHANVGMRSLMKMKQMQQMQQMVEGTQISIKLRRGTNGDAWEVVNVQDADETLAVFASMQQDISNQKRQQTVHTNRSPAPSSVLEDSVLHLKTLGLRPATANSIETPPSLSNTTSDSQTLSSDCFTPNCNDRLESDPLPHSPGPIEDSDEQIEKLLEDIMMGLNILPNLQRDSAKSHPPQTSHDRAPASCQLPHTEGGGVQRQMDYGAAAAGCGCHHGFGSSSSEAGTHCCFTGKNGPSCSNLSCVQQQCSSPKNFSVPPMRQRDEASHPSVAPTSQNPNHEVPTASATAFCSRGKQLHHPDCCVQESPREDQSICGVLPLTDGNDARPSCPVSVPSINDFRLPPCLSPLRSSSSAANQQLNMNSTANQSNTVDHPQVPHRPLWLSKDPMSAQFPLCAVANKNHKQMRVRNRSCNRKRRQKDPVLTSHKEEISDQPEQVSEMVGQDSVDKRKPVHRRKRRDSNCKSVAAPKRRRRTRRSLQQEPAGPHDNKEVSVSEGAQSQMSFCVCSVSLSSNNVLAKERDKATSSPAVPVNVMGNPNEESNITEGLRVKPRQPRCPIGTRSFVRKTQKTLQISSPEHTSVLKPPVPEAKTVKNRVASVTVRKRGRPAKIKLQESSEIPHAINEHEADTADREQGFDNSSSKVEGAEKAEKKSRKRRRHRSDLEVAPKKKTLSAEGTSTTETDINNNKNPAVRRPRRPRMVSLKEFKKLFKPPFLNLRKPKESQDNNMDKSAGNVENRKSDQDDGDEELTRTIEEVIRQCRITEESEESCSISNGTANENQDPTLNGTESVDSEQQPEDGCNSAGSSGEELCSIKSSDVLEEDLEKAAVEREPPLRKLHKALACDESVLGTAQQAIKTDTASPQTPVRTGSFLMDNDGCHQREMNGEEEEDDVEVDILLCTPEKVSESRYCETGVDKGDVIPEEEEEEEDVNVTDVTGDEAE